MAFVQEFTQLLLKNQIKETFLDLRKLVLVQEEELLEVIKEKKMVPQTDLQMVREKVLPEKELIWVMVLKEVLTDLKWQR